MKIGKKKEALIIQGGKQNHQQVNNQIFVDNFLIFVFKNFGRVCRKQSWRNIRLKNFLSNFVETITESLF